MKDRAWIEINFENLEHNVGTLCEAMPNGCRLMAVVKADAYGHDAQAVAPFLENLGVRAFAVATIDEGIALRKSGIRSEILILGYTAPYRAMELHCYGLMQSLISYGYAVELSQQGYTVDAHIKIDTGMHRLGFTYDDIEEITACFFLPGLRICGIFSHLCVSDSIQTQDVEFTKLQIRRFDRLLDQLSSSGIAVPATHLQSSYGLWNYPELHYDYIRIGIALYGVHTRPGMQTKLQLDLRPVLSMKTKIIQLRTVSAGETVGYGRCFYAERNSKIAVLPIGYADGIPRSLSGGKMYVLINGCRAPVVGKICMDQLTADVTDIPDTQIGMTATLIGHDGKYEISAEALASQADSITNELLSRAGERLKIYGSFTGPR